MARNTELLEQVMQHITDHPEQHDQLLWVNQCGTAACFAGWAVILDGWTVLHDEDACEPWVSKPTHWYPQEPISRRAVRLLGLTSVEAHKLFEPDNSREMLALMVKDLVNGDELRPWCDYEAEAS